MHVGRYVAKPVEVTLGLDLQLVQGPQIRITFAMF